MKGSSTPTTVKIIGKISTQVPNEGGGRITREESDNKYEDEELVSCRDTQPLQCYEQSNVLQGPTRLRHVSCAGLNICDGVLGRRSFET